MRILIADDHAIVRRGLRQIVTTHPGWTVVGEAARASELLDLLRHLPAVDVLVLDVTLGDRSGIDLLEPIRAAYPRLPVLILSMHAESHYALHAIRAGAMGYIQKDRSPDEIVRAIERVASGRTYIGAAVADQMIAALSSGEFTHPHARLSNREFEVFRLLAEGKSLTEIASLLHVSIKTVSTYRRRILDKTGFESNAQLVSYAVRNDLI